MKVEDVPSEWVELGKKAHTLYPIPMTIPATLPTADEAWERQVRWIIAAVAPLIAAALVEALEGVLPAAESYWDAGPEGEGWQSHELSEACEKARAALALYRRQA